MVGHGGSSAGWYLADPTSPINSHCASIVVTSTLRVNVTFVSHFVRPQVFPNNGLHVPGITYHLITHTHQSPEYPSSYLQQRAIFVYYFLAFTSIFWQFRRIAWYWFSINRHNSVNGCVWFPTIVMCMLVS